MHFLRHPWFQVRNTDSACKGHHRTPAIKPPMSKQDQIYWQLRGDEQLINTYISLLLGLDDWQGTDQQMADIESCRVPGTRLPANQGPTALPVANHSGTPAIRPCAGLVAGLHLSSDHGICHMFMVRALLCCTKPGIFMQQGPYTPVYT